MNNRGLVCLLGVLAALLAVSAGAAPASGVEHVIVVGVDGMTASSVNRAKTPNMHDIMKSGAYTLHARSVDPSVSSPNWASMIMGAKPETHGITSNDWKSGDTPAFPTIFGVCRAAHPDADIAAVYEWGGFGNLFKRADVTFYRNAKSGFWQLYVGRRSHADATIQTAVRRIGENRPLLSFVHLDLAVAMADTHVGQVMRAVRDAGMSDKTVFFVVSDHGGKGQSHGGMTDEETTVPWMAAGPGIAVGREITDAVGVAQTAPTIATVLGLTPPEKWTEKPVAQIFE